MKYAVIETGGKQYKVSEGQILEIERISQPSSSKNLEKNKPVEFGQVLLLVDGSKVTVGKPNVNAAVKAKVIDQFRGDKIHVFKYKAKTGYHRKIGHRQALTRVLIEKISEVGGKENLRKEKHGS